MSQPSGLQLRSLVTPDGTLVLALEEVPTPAPGPDEVVVRIDAAPINPSDLGLLLGGADPANAVASGTDGRPEIRIPLTPELLRAAKVRVGQSLPVGNEGGGVVVATGSGPEARALEGRTVGVLGGAMYGQYRVLKSQQCLALPDGVSARDGAACFVNPLTALGMIETTRLEGHRALVHTAAASNLGQMLVMACATDSVPLVNVVRRPEQVALLTALGAAHVVDSSSESFMDDLITAVTATGATVAFDAIGGGTLGGQILTAMEVAANASATEFSRYGSNTFKQLYIYGGLDRGPTVLQRSFGFSWAAGGWLLTPFLQKIGADAAQALRQRVASEITSTFASSYTDSITLAEMLRPDTLRSYARMATGQKYLVVPNP
jgi:NADPH:quinone reductase